MPGQSVSDVIAERFEIGTLLGGGAMGVVFRARDHATGADVAVKVLRNAQGDTARFQREARVLSDLYHAHIVRYVAHGVTTAGELWMAMEWRTWLQASARRLAA